MGMGVQDDIKGSYAEWSSDKKYRYLLFRCWDTSKPVFAVIGLNPSTADEKNDDPTVRRCINFVRRHGGGAMVMLNAFAIRSTDPSMIYYTDQDPIGEENDYHILTVCSDGDITVILAWGNRGRHNNRHQQLLGMLEKRELLCFGVNLDNTPKHPLYLQNDTQLAKYGEGRNEERGKCSNI